MRAALLAGLLALSACASQPRVQTTIPAAMAGIQSSLAQAGAVSVSHAADWTPEQTARFERDVRAAQCSQRTSDPVIGTIAGNVTLGLSGSFTQAGQFTAGAITTAPTVGLQGSASRTRIQQVGYETELLGQNDDARHQEAAQLIEDRQALRDRVGELVDSWSAEQCIPHAPVLSLVGGRR
ncbi:hypothetical protein CFR73_07695 [Novacetimonas maltaceti]|uniref:Lipoprotein n=1 Tax=Novacetimonas maltaceti TaxID=1203393 RepID=A0A2S3W5Q9_9PROT|nr:hypothetical protein [Novacetimonas maltaceti]POF63873.1 hypothetical protein KMAL_04040 [Novacetimonas maltaceti]PYD60283.1 hypothetical protein CFR73_07695 [Novacetimonas maltaceti]BCZ76004.1 hypothetical protein [Komagataeibacter phage phiKM1]